MDTYMIRIYQRQENDPHTLTGTVAGPGIRGKKDFANLDQLWGILNSKKKKQSRLKRKIKVLNKGRKP